MELPLSMEPRPSKEPCLENTGQEGLVCPVAHRQRKAAGNPGMVGSCSRTADIDRSLAGTTGPRQRPEVELQEIANAGMSVGCRLRSHTGCEGVGCSNSLRSTLYLTKQEKDH